MKWALSWLCYWLGDLVSKPMNVFDTSWLYPVNHRLMCWSDDLQGDDRGPWQPVIEDEDGTPILRKLKKP